MEKQPLNNSSSSSFTSRNLNWICEAGFS